MNTTEKTKNTTLTTVCCDTTITHDVSEEFTLPDYVNEVRRVLTTRAQVLPESKYIADTQGGVSLDFGGTVTYFVVYTDDEGKLCSTPLSSNYEATTILKSTPNDFFIDTIVDSVTTRVSAPRRLTIKSRLKSRIFGYCETEMAESITPKTNVDELYIERLGVTFDTIGVGSSSLQGIKVSDKFDTGALNSLRPVLCDANVILKDVKSSNGSVSCRGEVSVKCLCESESELIALSKSVPIYEEIALDGASVGDSARATARCVSLSISSEESDQGAQIFFDVVCEIDCEALRNEQITLTKDAYSTKNPIEARYKDIEAYSLLKASNASLSVNEGVKKKSKEALEVVDAFVDPVFEKCDIKGNTACFIGRLCATVIAKTTTEDFEYVCESYDIPVKYECEITRSCDDMICRASFGACVTNAKYSDDKFMISAEVYPSVMALAKSSVGVLDSAILKKDTEFKRDASSVRVFFPKDGDILWEIAKKYHTTRDKIIEQNSLDGESLDGIKSIIV